LGWETPEKLHSILPARDGELQKPSQGEAASIQILENILSIRRNQEVQLNPSNK